MNLPRSILAALFVGLAANSALAQGKTYPNGTVSPFAPGFFGVGIPDGATQSYVFGVAAQGGKFIAAVGEIRGLANGSGQEPALWAAGKSFVGLPRLAGPTNGGTASGISADGKIKVGDGSGGAVYWDENNNVHLFPAGGDEVQSNVAAAITPDGTYVAGSTVAEVRPDGERIFRACRWAPGVPGIGRLGTLPNFDNSFATAISAGGEDIVGFATRTDASTFPPTHDIRAFLHNGDGMRELDAGNPAGETQAHGVARVPLPNGQFETLIAGTSGPAGNTKATLWTLIVGLDHTVLDGNDSTSAAYAIQGTARNIGHPPGRIVGFTGNSANTQAMMWNGVGNILGTIRGLLASQYYYAPIPEWRPEIAYAISADGYTVGGAGTNPAGKKEGWVAVLPPILQPPVFLKPPNQTVPPETTYIYQVKVSTPDPTTFSAKGLPPGFEMSSEGVIVGSWSSSQTEKAGSYTVTVTGKSSEGTSTTTFKMFLEKPPTGGGGIKKTDIEGHGYLPQNKPPDEQTFLASFSTGISADGQIAVGHDRVANDSRAYRWTAAEGASGLPMLDGALRTYSTATAISADGSTIVGQAATAPVDDGFEPTVATVWRTASATNSKAIQQKKRHYAESEASAGLEAINLGLFPGGIISIANGVSANGGVVVGYGDGEDADPTFGVQIYQAFRWTQSTGTVGLGWIDTASKFSQAHGVSADGSIIVGVDGQQAMRWTEASGMVGLGKAPGATRARALAVSADNSTIIGFNAFSAGTNTNRAFRWTAAEGMTDLGVLPGEGFSEAKALSADGSVIVGESGVRFVSGRAFIWDKINGMRDLKSVLVANNPNLANWNLRSADGISPDGNTITGFGINPNGDPEGYTAVLEVRSAQLLNISTRMRVLTGERVLIGGFIITGTVAKKVMIRGIGPSLANLGVQGVLTDPTLEIFQGSGAIGRNDNWKTRPDGSSQQVEIEATTIPPSNDLESALVMTLAPGAYTAILADKNSGPGVGLVEVYDLAPQSNSKLANISTRGFVDTGDNVMIGGFIAGGGTAGATAGEVIRAIGPSLTGVGVAGALQDTTLELYNGSGTLLASNDNWKLRADGTSQEAEINATTIPPGDDRESAVAVVLAPGNYTAVVRGAGNSTGVGLVEVYHLQ